MRAAAIVLITYFIGTAMTATAAERPHFFATAEGAALAAVYPGKFPIKIARINVAGRYATVLMQGANIEGTPDKVPVLVERFPFGWQALESLDFVCRLTTHDLGVSKEERLMRGMPAPQNDSPCLGSQKDVGPEQQVDALRRASFGPLTSSVKVVGDWAVVEHYGAGGGQTLYRLSGGQWQVVQRGGGALDVDSVRASRLPEPYWCVLDVAGAKCPKHAP